MLVGLLVAGIISAIVPEDFFAGALGTGFTGMVVMMILGIPIYVCATASVPVAVALIAKGVSPGAALVFLMTGPATNAAAIAVVWQILGKRTTFIYLGAVAVAALASGLMLDYIFGVSGLNPEPAMHEMMPWYAKSFFALALLAVLAYAFYRPAPRGEGSMAEIDAPEKVTLHIKGMTCSHCAQSVKTALLAAPGVGIVEVDQPSGKATVGGSKLDLSFMRRAVEEVGFKLTSVDGPHTT